MRPNLVPVDDIVTVDEIAKRLHWSVNACLNVVTGRDGRYKLKFPRPLVGCAKRGVWLWTDVEAWYEETAPKSILSRKRTAQVPDSTYKRPSWRSGRKSA